MRGIQRGISTLIILVILLTIGIAIVSGYFIFYQQKVDSINSFDDCQKAGYPVMESYPAQCRTTDGKHFVQELSEQEKKKLIPPSDGQVDGIYSWNTYINNNLGYSIKYPSNIKIKENFRGQGTTSFYREGLSGGLSNDGMTDPVGMNVYSREYKRIDGSPNVESEFNGYLILKADRLVTNEEFTEFYWISSDDLKKTIRINIETMGDKKPYDRDTFEIFQKMLTTFRFLK